MSSRRREGFALVVTLIILSLLVVVVVSYLTSVTNERATANAYTAKTRAEQAAQAGVEAAQAMLTQAFRDFPDSATVWDTQQSANYKGTANPNSPPLSYNEGTTLYLRAAPKANITPTTAEPQPPPSDSNNPHDAHDPKGNNPNNLNCKEFVLPLTSGVPGGSPRLVSDKTKALPSVDLTVTNPVLQPYVDLNTRRYAGDIQGVIGSPPDWTGTTPESSSLAPKPARAFWVNLTDGDKKLVGRYAFWVEDESFRLNANYTGQLGQSNTLRADNATDGKSLLDASGVPRSLLPSDLIFSGGLLGLNKIAVGSDINTASYVMNTRATYPSSFLPERTALLHSPTDPTGDVSLSADKVISTKLAEGMRYLTTTQSGTLNLTRHGTQRLNLNSPLTIARDKPTPKIEEIEGLVETLRFHLPNWGQRFYRTTNPDYTSLSATARSTILNRTTDVPAANSEIYLYKTAANLRDYLDADSQPTLVHAPDPTTNPAHNNKPFIAVPIATTGPIHPLTEQDGSNLFWAQGKDSAPWLQETMVRYRPAVQNDGDHYTLTVDYYIEFWNMTDKDIKASELGPNLYVYIGSPIGWRSAYARTNGGAPVKPFEAPEVHDLLTSDSGPPPQPSDQYGSRDFRIDIAHTVYRADDPNTAIADGVVFKAGAATVITTDPDFVARTNPINTPVSKSLYLYGGSKPGLYAANIYYCPNTKAAKAGETVARTFSGPNGLAVRPGYYRGIVPGCRANGSGPGVIIDYEIEAILANDFGCVDSATGSVCISAQKDDTRIPSTCGWDFTWTPSGDTHNDYVHGGTLGGNNLTAQELGDPRTNNEQINIKLYAGASYPTEPDANRYGAPGSGDNPPFSLGLPNALYLKPASTAHVWPDYFDWQTAVYPTPTLTAATAPSVVANGALTSIGQLGDLFDPARNPRLPTGDRGGLDVTYSRGGGRTLKIGQRDDRFTYDATTNTGASNNTLDNVPASNGWASWRLTDVFGLTDNLELPARINVNGVTRDGGAALRAALTGFRFQPTTTTDALIHGAGNLTGNSLAGVELKSGVTDTTGANQIITLLTQRLKTASSASNTPWGPLFERGEFGELESTNGAALFGKNQVGNNNTASRDLLAQGVDMNKSFDSGREEVFRRLAELICTRGDTFTVYAIGQSLNQTDANQPPKITSTHRMRVTFRLIPWQLDPVTKTYKRFHPGSEVDGNEVIIGAKYFNPESSAAINTRFAKPDRYDVQVLEVSTL